MKTKNINKLLFVILVILLSMYIFNLIKKKEGFNYKIREYYRSCRKGTNKIINNIKISPFSNRKKK